MKTKLLFLGFVIFAIHIQAQFTIPLPQIIAPTNHIYLSPTGNDANAGTITLPKKTFQAALSAFPFGVTGVNNSQSYNEIIFLAGDYYPTQTLSQTATQFLLNQGGVKMYKNVSVRGIGKVTIHGDNATNVGYSTLLSLMGSHIFVRNITLKNSQYGGLKVIGGSRHVSNVLIDSLIVDGASSHGCLLDLVDTAWVKNSTITNTCNLNSNETTSNCQWASGLECLFAKNITFENNKVYRNWGEGVNTALSEGIHCKNNVIYDNYSVNVYLHSASKGIWEGNLVYNQDSAFWRACYNNGKRIPPDGFSIANELTCTYACVGGGNNQSCGGKYHCCAVDGYDITGYQATPYRQTDSIFIYNNVVLQANLNIWDAFSGFFKYAYIKDIFVENNTFIGLSGRNGYSKVPFNVNLGTAFVYAQNIQFKNNIVSQDTTLTSAKNGLFVNMSAGTCNGISAANLITLKNNRLNMSKICNNSTIGTTNEQILTSLPTHILPSQISQLVPNTTQSYWIQTGTHSPYITKDYYGNPRSTLTNVGAFEKGSLSDISQNADNELVKIFPNPAIHTLFIQNKQCQSYDIAIYDLQGKKLIEKKQQIGDIQMDLELVAGYYFVYISMVDGKSEVKKLWIEE